MKRRNPTSKGQKGLRQKGFKGFDQENEVRAIARERVGRVKPSQVIVPKKDRKPKHKPPLAEE